MPTLYTPNLSIPYPSTGDTPYDLHTALIQIDSYLYNRVNLSPGAQQSGFLNLSGAGTFGGNLTVGGAATISGAATVGGTLGVTGALTAPNVAYVNAPNTFTANQTMTSGYTISTSDYNASTPYGYRLGSDYCDFGHVRIRGLLVGGVMGSSFVAATSGAQVVAKAASVVSAGGSLTTPSSVTSGVTTTNVTVDTSATGSALFVVNDAVRVRAVIGGALKAVEAIVTTANTPVGNLQTLVLTLYTGTSTSVTFPAGTAIVNYGPSGSSYITLSADGAFGGAGANISLWGHSGQPWTDSVRTVAIPADGQVRIGSNVAAAATTSFAVFPSAVTYNSETMVAGSVLIGDNTAGGTPKANVYWDPTANQLKFRSGTTTHAYIDTDGKIKAGAGRIVLDSTALTINNTANETEDSRILFKNIDPNELARISTYYSTTNPTLTVLNILSNYGAFFNTGSLRIRSTNSLGDHAEIRVTSTATEQYVAITEQLSVGRNDVPGSGEQLRLWYDGSNYVPFTVSSGGDLTIAPTGGDVNITGALSLTTPLTDANVANDLTIDATKIIKTTLTTEQLRLLYDGSNYASFTVNSGGDLTIAPSGGDMTANANTLVVSQATGTAGLIVRGKASQSANLITGQTSTPTDVFLVTKDGYVGVGTSSVTANYALRVAGSALMDTTSTFLSFGATSFAAPTTGTRSSGTKIVFYDTLGPTTTDYAAGVQGNHMWYSTQSTSAAGASTGHIFYAGTTILAYIESHTGGGSMVYIPAAGYGPPTTGTRSIGTKIVFWPALDGSNVDFAAGIDENTLLHSVPSVSQFFKWYAGTALKTQMDGYGTWWIGATPSYGGGQRGIGIENATTNPSSTPTNGFMLYSDTARAKIREDANRFIVQAASKTKTTAGAPYTNDGYLTITIDGTDYKVMTTA